MTLQFDIGAFVALSRAGTYSFTLTPKTALVSDVTIRWAIVPKGATAVVNDFSSLTGTLSLSSGSTTTQAITVTPTDDALATLSGEFEIQIYQVVADGDDILLSSQDVTFSDAETGAGVATVETPPAQPGVEGPEAEPVIQAESVEQSFEIVEEQTTITHPEAEAEPAPPSVEGPETTLLISSGAYTLLSSTKGDDTIAGISAAELIQGGSGHDTITTGGGDDVVIGGFGEDTITLSVDSDGNGETHAETVVYRYKSLTRGDIENDSKLYGNSAIQPADGADVITGFRRGVDKLILAEMGAAYYIENNDAVADKSDITEDILAQKFTSKLWGVSGAKSSTDAGVEMSIILNDWDFFDSEANGLTKAGVDAGGRWGIRFSFSAYGFVSGLTGSQADYAGSAFTIYFDKETTIWLEKQENWDKITGGDDYSKSHVVSLEGLRFLFGDSDANDDLLQFALEDELGVEVGTPDAVTVSESTPPAVDAPEPEVEPEPEPEAEAAPQAVVAEPETAPETAFLINPASYTLLSGTKGSDTIVGTSATELIQGGHYNDIITTGGGDDVVIGGFGKDTIILSVDDEGNGAEHAETVVYRYMSPTFDELQSYPGFHYEAGSILPTDGRDVITGFSRGVDKLILAELGEAYYIENNDAVADKSDITEDIIAQEFVNHILGANDSKIRNGADIKVTIIINDWDFFDSDTESLTAEGIDAGGRWGVELHFTGPGYMDGFTGTNAEDASSYTDIYFDKETTIWLEKQENWDKVTDGTNYSNSAIESLEGLRYLFGDSDENDDLLQFTTADGLGVEVGTPDVVTTTEPTPQVVDDVPETAFLINPASYTLITGTKGSDTIVGTSATELIQGSHYNDTITTGGGDDVVIGGFGSDTIILSVDDEGNGAEHAETVVYRYFSPTFDELQSYPGFHYDDSGTHPTDGGDVITGFSRGVDKLILADIGVAHYIESLDAVADKSDITEDIITQEFVSHLWGTNDGNIGKDADIKVGITLNDWWGLDWDTDWGADGLSTDALDAGFRLGIELIFSGPGYMDGLPSGKRTFGYTEIYFDRETSIWLGKQENWEKVGGGGANHTKSKIESLEGLRYLFGDTDENDDLLQFTTADGLGVEVL